VHGAARHRGREYEAPAFSSEVSALDELRERLQQAVASEEFELAATLRDQIRALE